MAKKRNGIVRKYHHNYKRLYPGVEISEEILDVLNDTDREFKKIDYDLKHETSKRNTEGIIEYIPPRERSIEQIGSSDWYASSEPSAEELFLQDEQRKELHKCILLLDEDEQTLIKAIYFDGLSDTAYAQSVGMSQTGLSKKRRSILCKLLKMLD